MANLTIKNIPEELYQKLKKSAKLNRRSMNSEILVCLEQVLLKPELDQTKILQRIRQLRAQSNRNLLTDEQILKLKNEGRQ